MSLFRWDRSQKLREQELARMARRLDDLRPAGSDHSGHYFGKFAAVDTEGPLAEPDVAYLRESLGLADDVEI